MSAQTDNLDALSKLRIKRSDDPPPRSRRFFTLFTAVAACLAMATGGFALTNWDDLATRFAVPDAIKSRTEVQVTRAAVQKGRSADATVVATGYLEARQQAKIGARAPGRIESIRVEEGSRVDANEVLAVLEHADLDASLASARAVVEQARAQVAEQEVEISRAKRDLERATSLRGKAGISASEFDQTNFQYEATLARRDSLLASVALSEARVGEAEQLRENMFIRASFAGTVISKDAEVGESILPGGMGEASGRGSVVTVADLDHLEVECDVKEDFIGRVQIDAQTEVAVDAVNDRRYHGRVRKVIPMGDRARATIKVKVEITDSDERLFPEMSATVYFLPDENTTIEADQPRVFGPANAIRRDEIGEFVFVVDSGQHVRRVEVGTIGANRDGRIEIASGLVGDELCVINPPDTLRDGDLVKVSE